jgi:hypothetical protein
MGLHLIQFEFEGWRCFGNFGVDNCLITIGSLVRLVTFHELELELIQTQMAQKPMLRAPFLDDSGTAAAAYWFGDTFSAEWTLQKALECTGLLVNFKELQGC